jgi:hypothetical protein
MVFSFSNVVSQELPRHPLEGLISNILGGYKQGAEARYLKPRLEEELKKQQLANQYYGPNIESEMALRGAHAGLLGEQTKGAQIENQYLPEFKKAQIDQLRSQAEKARMLQMIREQLMGGGSSGMSQEQSPMMQMYQGHGMPEQQSQSMQQPQQPTQPQSQGMPSYVQAALASQALGLGQPKIVESNGKYLAITPFGVVDTGAQGLTEKNKYLAREDAKTISKLEDIVLKSSQKENTFNELNSDLGSDEFEAMRKNPILGRKEIGYYEKFGTPEQQEMVGRVKTYMGNIVKDSARDFAGQFRIGEQALLNDMKPNIGDSLDVMKGKAEALTYLNTMMARRAELESDFMRNYNMTALQAKIAADKQIDSKQIKKDIAIMLHPASSKKGNYSQSDLEFTAKKHGMTVDEVRQKLEAR